MATNTYVALDKVTVGTATPTITFSGISGSYTDLVIVGNWGQSLDAESCLFRVGNGSIDSGSNYSATELYGTGSAAGSQRTTNATGARITFASGGGSAVTSNFQLHLMNYANTTTNKTFITRTSVPSSTYPSSSAFVSLWRSTAAINTVQLYLTGGNFLAGSTFSLYGIAAEGTSPAPKATGGAIYQDSTYYYHVFGLTGTFTPLQSLSVDALVVGGGGGASIGGGGAGGLRSGTSLSVTAQNYTVTVGSGGANVSTNAAGGNGTSSTFSTITSSGGGGGGGTESITKNGQAGGSGGGGGINSTNSSEQVSGGSGNLGNYTPVEGYAGGSGRYWGLEFGGGGGGGASQVGVNVAPSSGVVSTLGNGGDGSSAYSSWGVATGVGQLISGTYYLAGGGGGGGRSATPGTGGAGGGGNGSVTTVGTNGTANTGGGGGGANQGTTRGNGGSGVVIVRYAK